MTNTYCQNGYCSPVEIKTKETSHSTLGEQLFNIGAFVLALAASIAMIAFTYIS